MIRIAYLLLLLVPGLSHAAESLAGSVFSVLGSLVLIVGLIVVLGVVTRKLNRQTQVGRHVRVLQVVSLGLKEKLVLIQMDDRRLLLGVTPQRISLLDQREGVMVEAEPADDDFARRLYEMIGKGWPR